MTIPKTKKCFQKFWYLVQHPSPLDNHIFCKKHPRKKCQKVDPHYFTILEGDYFLHFFSSFKGPQNQDLAQNCNFLTKYYVLNFRGKLAVLRQLELFFEKN